MSMVVMHNIPALSAYNTVNRTSSSLQKSIQKLSTGLRINSAADDAAGLAISEKMRAQIRGLDRAVSNSQDGISMIQTAEGALNETHSILQRMRELSVQSANDTLTQQDRGYIQQEIDQLREEITRIGNTTQFNKKKLLNGDAAVLWSSDNLNTKAIINGGLRQVDQFGQKKAAEGNYKIKIKAEAGQGEIQKSDIFRIKHDLNAWNAKTNTTYGIASGDKQKAPEIKGGGLYTITGKVITPATTQNGAATLTSKTSVGSFAVAGGGLATLDTNANIKFKVESVDGNDIKLSYEGQLIGKDGKVAADPVKGTMTVTAGGAVGSLSIGGKTVTLGAAAGDAESFKAGDELVYNFSAAGSGDAGDVAVTIKGSPENGLMADHSFVINKKAAQDKELEFRVSYLETDPKNPEIKEINEGKIFLKTGKNFADAVKDGEWASFRRGVSMPKDDDPSWLTTLNTMSTAASLSTNMPKGGWYNITSKAAVAGDGTWNMLQSSNGKALAQMGLSGTALDDVGASGILELTVGAVTAHTGGTTGSVALTGKFWGTKKDGTALNGAALDAITALANGALESELKTGATKLGKLKLDGLAKITADNFKSGDKIYIAVGANRAANDVVMKMDGRDENGNKLFTNYTPEVVVTPAADQNVNFVTPFSSDGKDIDFTKAKFDASDLGTASVTLNSAAFLGANAAAIAANLNNKTLASFNWGVDKLAKISSTIGEVASSKTKLADLEKFWDAQGRFMITDPQTITITQGDGRQAKVTLYKDDTLGSMAEKLNNAIAKTLNQGQYVDDMSKFVTFVNKETDEDTPESAKGTLVIRTVVPGATGRINFAGDEDVIKALSLNTIQDAKETNYTVNITDAHTGATVLEDTKITGNRLIGALHPNVDVEFDAMAGITAEWDKTKKVFTSKTIDYETVLHLADNTTVFQIGANEGEDMGINIGDMRSHALGLNAVLVTDRESAARSITIIDNAIDKVSTQRAKLGAYQNRLEHTINNLTVAGENLTAAESRIRDTDMAKEMMNFTKLQIMLQAGTSMLAQANQLPQTVMTLIR